ncbi:SRPBCC family protein [Permianibacter sp. IMCC34836]|uniref:SRPBCC family protein n=1 Tax=Permianibacter fluminis TaxID=2738515 RepID=UPI001551B94E|nr:SRPBCC family protein [Permianibacter fluminis]NQD36369.1 SRPBCC family protein [Permianibacter fluminis]
MIVDAQVTINASRPAVWATMTDIANAATTINGIEQIEIVEQPTNGLVGLRWRETRILFGKPATAEKWITEAVENEFYKTRAESDGFIFLSTNRISDGSGGLILTSIHESLPQTLATKLMVIPMSLLFKGVAKNAILQDLLDIKSVAEQQ